MEQVDILRRICDRGLNLALMEQHTHFTDLFQHLLDEIERLEKYNLITQKFDSIK